MKRILLLAVLCLLSAPAKASTVSFTMDEPYISQTWTLEILASSNPFGQFHVFSSGGPYITQGIAFFGDPATFSTTEFVIDIRGLGGSYIEDRHECNESDFHCSRNDRVTPLFNFALVPQTLTISVWERVTGPYAVYGPLSIGLSFPDDVILAAPVPEPSTWVLMLLGFAALGYAGVSRVERSPRRIAG